MGGSMSTSSGPSFGRADDEEYSYFGASFGGSNSYNGAAFPSDASPFSGRRPRFDSGFSSHAAASAFSPGPSFARGPAFAADTAIFPGPAFYAGSLFPHEPAFSCEKIPSLSTKPSIGDVDISKPNLAVGKWDYNIRPRVEIHAPKTFNFLDKTIGSDSIPVDVRFGGKAFVCRQEPGYDVGLSADYSGEVSNHRANHFEARMPRLSATFAKGKGIASVEPLDLAMSKTIFSCEYTVDTDALMRKKQTARDGPARVTIGGYAPLFVAPEGSRVIRGWPVNDSLAALDLSITGKLEKDWSTDSRTTLEVGRHNMFTPDSRYSTLTVRHCQKASSRVSARSQVDVLQSDVGLNWAVCLGVEGKGKIGTADIIVGGDIKMESDSKTPLTWSAAVKVKP
ncbi:uncharacterized protein BBA_09614 [Beauveria bassiana ARSEF 2860]|uniref:Uncharacterized protein n=1 Tax=Beauveria bassiana (strain ARSEF 2860) TaxID=655819 RepID=J4KL17_BEAB2|nr:uncharacterized protein BBA_09614 [Beauveria bassiana ARSEF 2860]EJP61424.1 hypothetical protein BBA_09614 [Beauveria bassiana ARSEF 2860]